MKKLLLLILFSGFLDSFSQDTVNHFNPLGASINLEDYKVTLEVKPRYGYTGEVVPSDRIVIKPDTLRAIVLVTLSPNGIAHARMGFVVISEGKRPVYLDCRKKALKLPQVGWDYQIVNPNEQR